MKVARNSQEESRFMTCVLATDWRQRNISIEWKAKCASIFINWFFPWEEETSDASPISGRN
jgi:hypothetical protein